MCKKLVQIVTATIAAVLWSASHRVGWASSLLAQAQGNQPGGKSGEDFIIPAIVVGLLIGASLYAVCRSSRRI